MIHICVTAAPTKTNFVQFLALCVFFSPFHSFPKKKSAKGTFCLIFGFSNLYFRYIFRFIHSHDRNAKEITINEVKKRIMCKPNHRNSVNIPFFINCSRYAIMYSKSYPLSDNTLFCCTEYCSFHFIPIICFIQMMRTRQKHIMRSEFQGDFVIEFNVS